jgi:hypothetical protein
MKTTALFFALGQAEKMTHASTLGAHKEYAKSTPEQQAQLMHDCIVQFIMGYTDCDLKAAERILSQTRTERSKKSQDAYYKGYSKFRYHIIRPETAPALPDSSGRQVKVSAPKALVKTVVNEIINSGITKAEFDALITELRASIAFE